jgi:hypothetical protein
MPLARPARRVHRRRINHPTGPEDAMERPMEGMSDEMPMGGDAEAPTPRTPARRRRTAKPKKAKRAAGKRRGTAKGRGKPGSKAKGRGKPRSKAKGRTKARGARGKRSRR